jgi:hypothetical protein
MKTYWHRMFLLKTFKTINIETAETLLLLSLTV